MPYITENGGQVWQGEALPASSRTTITAALAAHDTRLDALEGGSVNGLTITVTTGTFTLTNGKTLAVANSLTFSGTDGTAITFGAHTTVLRTTGPTDVTLPTSGTVATRNDLSEVVTAANVITAAESGTVFYLDSATEFPSTLPAPAAGLHYTFIVKRGPIGANYTIASAGGAIIIIAQTYTSEVNSATNPGSTSAGCNTISFVASQSVVGDRVDIFCDGTRWYAYCFCAIFDAFTFTSP